MGLYDSIQSIIDSNEHSEIRAKLKELEVKHHHKEKIETLAEKLFIATGGEGEVQVEVKPKSEKKDDFFADLDKEITREVKKIKASKTPDTVIFVSKNHNLHLAPRGLNKDGQYMRFVEGHNTLDIGEQKASDSVFKIKPIVFQGISNPLYNDPNNGRGVLRTKNEYLKKYIRTHTGFQNQFFEYNPSEIERIDNAKDRVITLLKAGMYKASDDDLVMIVSYMDMKAGRKNTFDSLYQRVDTETLISKCRKYINNSPDLFREAMTSKISKVIFMINLAKANGLIKVTSDEREVQWGMDNKTIIQSSMTSDWRNDMVHHLTTPDGRKNFDILSDRTHVMFV